MWWLFDHTIGYFNCEELRYFTCNIEYFGTKKLIALKWNSTIWIYTTRGPIINLAFTSFSVTNKQSLCRKQLLAFNSGPFKSKPESPFNELKDQNRQSPTNLLQLVPHIIERPCPFPIIRIHVMDEYDKQSASVECQNGGHIKNGSRVSLFVDGLQFRPIVWSHMKMQWT